MRTPLLPLLLAIAILVALDSVGLAEPKSAQPSHTFLTRAVAHGLAFSPDGTLIAAGFAGGDVDVIDARTGTVAVSLKSNLYQPSRLKFSQDGKLLFAESGTGLFNSKNRYAVWKLTDRSLLTDAPTRRDPETIEHLINNAGAGDMSPDGKFLLIGGVTAGVVGQIDLTTRTMAIINPQFPPGRPWAVEMQFFPDGKQVAFYVMDPERKQDDALALVSFPKLALLKTLTVPPEENDKALRYRLMAGLRILGTKPGDDTIRLHDVQTGKIILDTKVKWADIERFEMIRQR